MEGLIFGLMFVYSIFHLLGAMVWDTYNMNTCFFSPRMVYNTYNVNWFGAIMIYLLYFITTPLLALAYIVYWICTVGR